MSYSKTSKFNFPHEERDRVIQDLKGLLSDYVENVPGCKIQESPTSLTLITDEEPWVIDIGPDYVETTADVYDLGTVEMFVKYGEERARRIESGEEEYPEDE